MAPGTHALIGWWTANVLPLSRRDRLLVFAGGVLPDIDGLGVFFSSDAYLRYHHILCHNLLACISATLLAAVLARQRVAAAALVFLNWHVHLACDYFGSRGPMTDPPWILPYLFPFVGTWSSAGFAGPAWYWNPWQWPLDSWPNFLVTGLAEIGWVYIAVRLDRTWFEFVWPRMDQVICRTLRKLFGGKPVERWPPLEGRVVRRSYLTVAVVAFLACIVAASRAGVAVTAGW
jgi:hypothetical protein